MSCAEWEELAALSVEGGISDVQAATLERHLAGCAECRDFASGVVETQAALQDLGQELPDPAEYVRLREGVMRRIAEEPRRFLWWPYAVAAGLALMLSIGYRYRDDGKRVANPEIIEAHVQPPVLAPVVRELRAPALARRRHRRKPLESAGPLVVKFATDDPDVVIIWVIDKKGD